MCGRYSLVTPEEALRNLFSVDNSLPTLSPRYNIAPTQDAPVIISTGDDRRSMVMMRWGLVPSWSPKGPDKRFSMFNARAETVSTKSAFRLAFRHRPCLVPVDGFYEWKKEKIGKTPHHHRRRFRQEIFGSTIQACVRLTRRVFPTSPNGRNRVSAGAPGREPGGPSDLPFPAAGINQVLH